MATLSFTTDRVSLSRAYLERAIAADNLLAAGCLLRESIRSSLKLLCEQHDCQPRPKRQRRWEATLPVMADALKQVGVFDQSNRDRVLYAIMIGNRLTRCRPVNRPAIEKAFGYARLLLDIC